MRPAYLTDLVRSATSVLSFGLAPFAVGVFLLTAAVPAEAQTLVWENGRWVPDVRYSLQHDFEDKIRARDPACMPEPFPLITTSYPGRLLDAGFKLCLSENSPKLQVVKYLALGALVVAGGPVGAAATTYGASELKSEGMKCVLKASVYALSDVSEQDKQKWNAIVDGGFAAKDAREFVSSARGAFDSWKKAAGYVPKFSKDVFETLAAVYERMKDGSEYSTALVDVALDNYKKTASAMARDMVMEEAHRHYEDGVLAMQQCRLQDAGTAFEAARAAAVKECPSTGVYYRLVEAELRTLVATSYSQLTVNNALASNVPIYDNPQQSDYRRLMSNLVKRRTQLDDFSQIFVDIDRQRQEAASRVLQLGDLRRAYDRQMARAQAALADKDSRICTEFDRLQAIVKQVPQGCGPTFLSEMVRETPQDLINSLNVLARNRSDAWWQAVDTIKADLEACRLDTVDSGLADLRAKMQAQPLEVVVGGDCLAVTQPELTRALAELTAQRNGASVVPDLRGMSPTDAQDALQRAQLVAGKPSLGDPADQADAVGTVSQSRPAAGTQLPLCTTVNVTLFGPVAETGDTGAHDTGTGNQEIGTKVGQSCGVKWTDEERHEAWDMLYKDYANGRWDQQYRYNDIRAISGVYKGLRDDIMKADYFAWHYTINIPVWNAKLACMDGCIMSTPKNLQVNEAAQRAFRQCEATCNEIRYAVCNSDGTIKRPPRLPPGMDVVAP